MLGARAKCPVSLFVFVEMTVCASTPLLLCLLNVFHQDDVKFSLFVKNVRTKLSLDAIRLFSAELFQCLIIFSNGPSSGPRKSPTVPSDKNFRNRLTPRLHSGHIIHVTDGYCTKKELEIPLSSSSRNRPTKLQHDLN